MDITRIINLNPQLLVEAADTLETVVKACIETDKPGSITLTIKLEPQRSKDGGHMLKVVPTVAAKNPRYDMPAQYMHVVLDNAGSPCDLAVEDPRQKDLFNQLVEVK